MSEKPITGKYTAWNVADGVAMIRLNYVQMLRFEEYSQLEAEILHAAEGPDIRAVVLNFDVLELFSSRLLGIIAAVAKRMKTKGRRLVVCRLRPEALRAFRLCRLDTIVPVFAGEEEARAAVEKTP
jgi:anti-anti-sigma factor